MAKVPLEYLIFQYPSTLVDVKPTLLYIHIHPYSLPLLVLKLMLVKEIYQDDR